MAHKARCKRCGAWVPAGYVECQPRVVYRTVPLSPWARAAMVMGTAAWAWLLAQVVANHWP